MDSALKKDSDCLIYFQAEAFQNFQWVPKNSVVPEHYKDCLGSFFKTMFGTCFPNFSLHLSRPGVSLNNWNILEICKSKLWNIWFLWGKHCKKPFLHT